MPTLDPRVDDYIAQAAEFAQPLLTRLRADLHAACPELVETIKWRHPNFLLDGKILANMAAFKAHCSLGFWRREGLDGVDQPREAFGDYGRITSPADLPTSAEVRRKAKAAAGLIRAGAPRAPSARGPRPALAAPDDFLQALAAHPAARQTFEGFPPGKQREYVEWVVEAKRDDTRAKRIAQSVAWLAEGKAKNWKYESC
jgi:uncharacterized protein YdeI (YjbR/CyaY-like superfamily)